MFSYFANSLTKKKKRKKTQKGQRVKQTILKVKKPA